MYESLITHQGSQATVGEMVCGLSVGQSLDWQCIFLARLALFRCCCPASVVLLVSPAQHCSCGPAVQAAGLHGPKQRVWWSWAYQLLPLVPSSCAACLIYLLAGMGWHGCWAHTDDMGWILGGEFTGGGKGQVRPMDG